MDRVLFTSNSDEWATPSELFDELNNEFHFDLDACATDDNHKVSNYYTKADNALTKNWGGTECFAIRHIVRLINGLLKHFMKPGTTTR